MVHAHLGVGPLPPVARALEVEVGAASVGRAVVPERSERPFQPPPLGGVGSPRPVRYRGEGGREGGEEGPAEGPRVQGFAFRVWGFKGSRLIVLGLRV